MENNLSLENVILASPPGGVVSFGPLASNADVSQKSGHISPGNVPTPSPITNVDPLLYVNFGESVVLDELS